MDFNNRDIYKYIYIKQMSCWISFAHLAAGFLDTCKMQLVVKGVARPLKGTPFCLSRVVQLCAHNTQSSLI